MNRLSIDQRVDILISLGDAISSQGYNLPSAIVQAEMHNPWFTQNNISISLQAISTQFLSRSAIQKVVSHYHLDDNLTPKTVGLVLAGNIPCVGWHDVMCVFLTGHIAQIKYSDKDRVLMSWMIDTMIKIHPDSGHYFQIVEKLKDYNAAIATGSNNTAQHFSYYFRHVPHIIRQNRNSISVINGNENKHELYLLGRDIFTYFGLGCRNVSMIFVPKNYEVTQFFEAWVDYKDLAMHNKYRNNCDYNVALYLLNRETFLHNEFICLKESDEIISRIGTVHYKRYQTVGEVSDWISIHKQKIQTVVTKIIDLNPESVGFGQSQEPDILTYADGVDTIQFLMGIS